MKPVGATVVAFCSELFALDKVYVKIGLAGMLLLERKRIGLSGGPGAAPCSDG